MRVPLRRVAAFAAPLLAVALAAACTPSQSPGASSTSAATAAPAAAPSASSAARPAPSAGAAASPAGSPSAGASGQSVSGSVTVYGALTAANGTALTNAFEKAYPNVKLSIVTAGTGPLVTRVESELKAGGVKADDLLLADPTVMPGLQQQGVLSSFTPAGAAQIPSALKGTGWVGAFTFNNVIVAHTGGTTPADWSDLTQPAYKGQVMLGDPAYSGTTLGMVGYLSQSLGWSYFQQLKANGAKVVQSTNTVGTDVAQGSVRAGITLDSVVRDLLAKGSPVQIVWPKSGAIPVPAPVAVVKGHESAASEAFVSWLLTPQGQAALVQFGYAPAIGPSSAVPANAKLVSVDWAKVTTDRQSILKQFQSIFS